MFQRSRSFPRRELSLTLAASAILFSACSSAPAASSTPSGAAIPSADPSHFPSVPPSSVPPPSPTLVPSGTPAASPTLPAVGAAPAGRWSAIHWLSTGALPLGPAEIGVYGWSSGFVALEQSPGSDDNGNDLPVTIRASSSPDGVTWTTPTTLETGFKGMIQISTIVE